MVLVWFYPPVRFGTHVVTRSIRRDPYPFVVLGNWMSAELSLAANAAIGADLEIGVPRRGGEAERKRRRGAPALCHVG